MLSKCNSIKVSDEKSLSMILLEVKWNTIVYFNWPWYRFHCARFDWTPFDTWYRLPITLLIKSPTHPGLNGDDNFPYLSQFPISWPNELRRPNIGRTLKPQRMASDNRWWPTLILLLLFPIQKLVNEETFSVVSLYNIQPPTLIANILHNQWAINGGKRGKSNSWRCAIDTTTTLTPLSASLFAACSDSLLI